MSLEWIKVRDNLVDDPRIRAIARVAKTEDPDTVVGKLVRLWAYTDQHSVDGHLPFAIPKDIDEIVRCPGFAEGLRAVDWISFDDSGAILTRFEEHNGATAKRRSQDARRQTRLRDSSRSERDASVTPSVTKLRQVRDLEEEEEEEEEQEEDKKKNQKKKKKEKDPPSAAPRNSLRLCPEDFDPNEHNQTLSAELGVDLAASLAEMRDWSRGNGKTRLDWNSVLSNWMRRKAGGGNANGGKQQPKFAGDRTVEAIRNVLGDDEEDAWNSARPVN